MIYNYSRNGKKYAFLDNIIGSYQNKGLTRKLYFQDSPASSVAKLSGSASHSAKSSEFSTK